MNIDLSGPDEYLNRILVATTNHNTFKSQLAEKRQYLEHMVSRRTLLKKVDATMEELVRLRTRGSVEQIENLINQGLNSIFEKKYEFKIESVTKRNMMYYQFWLVEDGKKVKIMDSKGGGVISVISLLLRIVVILLLKLKPVLVLDESLAQLSREYVDNAAEFFKELGKKLGFTIIMVTHSPEFLTYGDKSYKIKKVGQWAEFEEVKG